MELIPILSLIVLVATIFTFVLAIGAYILYKIRERGGKVAHAPQPETIAAELITPTYHIPEEYRGRYGEEKYSEYEKERKTSKEFDEKPATVFVRKQGMKDGVELRPTFDHNEHITTRTRQSTFKSTIESDPSGVKKKFLRYTKDGYVEPARDETNKEEVLRWR